MSRSGVYGPSLTFARSFEEQTEDGEEGTTGNSLTGLHGIIVHGGMIAAALIFTFIFKKRYKRTCSVDFSPFRFKCFLSRKYFSFPFALGWTIKYAFRLPSLFHNSLRKHSLFFLASFLAK